MELTVLGASGRTGQHIVRAALAADHEVRALVRHRSSLAIQHERLQVIEGDAVDAAAVRRAVGRSRAALSALGSTAGRTPTTVYTSGVANLLAAGARRIIAIGAIPAAPHQTKTVFERAVLHPMLHRFFGGSYDDMRRMEKVLQDSDADWTVLRPPRLTDGPTRGIYRTSAARLARPRSLSRGDLAAAMLAALDDPATVRRAIAISY